MTYANPYELIDRRLSAIEQVLQEIRQQRNNQVNPVDEVLTIQQAADFLKLTTQTIYGLVSDRKIPFSKPTNSRLYFSRLELIEWLKSNRTGTVQEQAQQYNDGSSRQLRRGGRKSA